MADTAPINGDTHQPDAKPTTNGIPTDIEMKEEPVTDDPTPPIADTLQPPSSAPEHLHQPTAPIPDAHTPPPAAPRASTPTAATAARAGSHPPTNTTPLPPPQANPHGSPTRVYLNQNVTPHLLEGMKYLAAYEPEKPLKWLAEFLAQKSRDVEGT